MSRILIAGCGAIGGALARALADAGHEVTGLKRHPPDPPRPCSYISADLSDRSTLTRLPSDVEIVVYAATPDRRDPQSYRNIFETGLDNLLIRLGPGRTSARWLFVSSTSVYAQDDGSWVDERSPCVPTAFNGKLLLQAEREIEKLGPGNCVVRFSGIYGPGRARLIEHALAGGEVQREPPYYTNRIHARDCVGVLKMLIEQQLGATPPASVYLASDDDPAPQWEILAWLAKALGKPPPVAITGPPGAAQNKRCCNRLLKALGYRFHYPSFREGYSELVERRLHG